MKAVALVVALAGCSGDAAREAPKPQEPVARAPATDARPEEPLGQLADGLPEDCGRYKQLAARLATCDALGPQRDLLNAELARSWQAWTALPADERPKVAEECKTAADALRTAVGPVCDW